MGRVFIQEELVYVASHEICWNEIIYIYVYVISSSYFEWLQQ